MARTTNKEAFGPPGVCDACGKPCCTMNQVGIPCYHCKVGTFMHRSLWRYTYINGDLIATPRDDVSERDVRAASTSPIPYDVDTRTHTPIGNDP
jgi:hypothetical protein